MSHFNSLAGESPFSRPAQNNQFGNTRNHEQNPVLIPKTAKLKPVDMNKGAGSKPLPKPLMVKPNFTVNSMETRFNPPVSNNKANSDSRSDAVGVKLPNRGTQENAYTQAPSGAGSQSPAKQKPLLHEKISIAPETTTGYLSVPKKKPLPSLFVLGKCPAKPQRPPLVNLSKFRGNGKIQTSMMKLQINWENSLKLLLMENCPPHRPENNKEPKEEKTTKESKELKKRLEKEEKKCLEQEKEEKKEREKKEQEARKKFKIKGPILVLETVKASVDHKGGKNKLPLKQGESIEIVRKTENPKDYWLARNPEGHCELLCRTVLDLHHKEFSNASHADKSLYVKSLFYRSFRKFSSTRQTNEMDPKKKKKFEKEEKEFRKKFKYNAEIKVLYQATVLQSLSIKKFGNKDLPVKPGEIIDVIVHPVDDKIIGLNSEGKCILSNRIIKKYMLI
uniref:FYN binding protein a n=1 Tax=Sinocyclocheilus anshuiensis TaxID=1608454 RepID=A0A671Q8K3_9TELE